MSRMMTAAFRVFAARALVSGNYRAIANRGGESAIVAWACDLREIAVTQTLPGKGVLLGTEKQALRRHMHRFRADG